MARDVFTVVLLQQRWMVRHRRTTFAALRHPGRSRHPQQSMRPTRPEIANPDGAQDRRPGLQQRLPNGVDLRR